MTSLDARIQRLEDIHEISNLKTRYMNAVNGGWDRPSHDGEKVASLFVEEGTWELDGMGKASGHKEIRDLLSSGRDLAPFALHMVLNPFIEVEGDEGIGEWTLICPSTDDKGTDYYSAVMYEDRFARVDGRWYFKSLRGTFIFVGPRETGWSKLVGTPPAFK